MKRGKDALKAVGVAVMCMLFIGLSLVYGSPAGEILIATPDQYDSGTVAEGKPVVVTTSIQNIGSTPIEITNVRTS